MRDRILVAAVLAAGLVVTVGTASVTATGTTIQQIQIANGTETDRIPTGEVIVIRGETNLQPDENAILIDVEDPNGTLVATASTDHWGRDGVWSVSVDTSDIAPGRYTVIADDGYDTDVERIRVVQPTPTATATETQAATSTEEPTEVDRSSTTVPRPTSTPTSTEVPSRSTTQTAAHGLALLDTVVFTVSAALFVVLYERSET